MAADHAPEPGLDTGTLLGKRYAAPTEVTFEVLVTEPASG